MKLFGGMAWLLCSHTHSSCDLYKTDGQETDGTQSLLRIYIELMIGGGQKDLFFSNVATDKVSILP